MRPLLLTACLLAPLPALAQGRFSEQEKTLYAVSTAHLDTQWRWTIQDTINSFIPNTMRTNFARFEESPDYTFSFEGAFRYMLMREYYPEDYARLKGYVAQGRWRVAGSSVDAGDVNISSPEALIRHVLLGNQVFDREFSKRSRDIFLPDCFGFGYALPTVAAHCGVLGFSTQKLSWGSAAGVPFAIGRWEGPDGSQIVAALEPGGYTSAIREDLSQSKGWLGAIDRLGKQSGVFAGYMYFGVGDTGGGPDAETIQWLDKSLTRDGPVKVVSAGSDQLYRDLTPDQKAKLPLYKGELLMTTHGTGCYTSQAAMKRWNRKNELLADSAERAAVAANWLGGAPYPKQKLDEAWVRFLWHQFHDDLTGTSIPEAYQFSWNDEAISQNQFAEVLADAAGAVSRALDTTAMGVPVVVYNPHSIAREDVVEATVRFRDAAPMAVRVYGPDGREVAAQLLQRDGNQAKILFLASVPSVGFAVYDVRPSATTSDLETGLQVTPSTLENARYRAALDENGDVGSVFDKTQGRELLAAPMRLELLRDQSPSWPCWEVLYREVHRAPEGLAGKPQTAFVTEEGPVRATIELTRYVGNSTVVQRISLAAGGAGDQLTFDTRIGWQTKGMMLKATFPLTAANPKATYDLGIGTIERGTNTPRMYEVPAQQWADLTHADGSFGATIINDCKYGWDHPEDNVLRLTLVRTPKPGQFPDQGSADLGRHEFKYGLFGHRGDWRNGAVWQAARMNQPLIAFQPPEHAGALSRTLSLLTVSDPRVAVRALKQAQASDEVIVRLQETSGQGAENVTLTLAAPILKAREANGAEEPLRALPPTAGKLILTLTPYQPRTLALTLGAPPVAVAPPAGTPLALPFNRDAISLDANKADGDLDGQGNTLPGELLPPALTVEGLPFNLGSSAPGALNAVACHGQAISLPATGDRLYLLAASTDGDQQATFTIGDATLQRTIPAWTGFVAQWDSRLVDGKTAHSYRQLATAFTKRGPLAWIGTHRHNRDGRNEAYVFCYLHKLALPLPSGAKSVRLPDDPSILVFAATVASDRNADTQPACDLFGRPVQVTDLPPLTLTAAPRKPDDPQHVTPGLNWSYYEGRFGSVNDFADAKPVRTGVSDTLGIPPEARREQFGLKLEGYIEAPKDGLYTFYTSSDDGSVLRIGDTVVVDNDGLHGQNEAFGEITLAAGKHKITVLYFQDPGDRVLEASWEGPGIERQGIAKEALWH